MENTASDTPEIVLLYVPCPDLAAAEALGRALVEARLAACANILPRMVSIYPWEGRVEREEEAVLIAKTAAATAPDAASLVAREHPYEVPAILTIPLAAVNPAYAGWLLGQIGAPASTKS